jgi:hypothetical protein
MELIIISQNEIHTAESMLAEPVTLRLGCLLKSQSRHKSPGIDRNPVELIKQEVG